MEKKVRVRFAPSPTGPLHIGGVRTALYNYLFAKHHNGEIFLRIEDTDQPRTIPGAEQYIIDSLNWCGIHFDAGPHIGGSAGPYRQSERMHLYKQYADQLIANGNAYYAFDSKEDIENMQARLIKAGKKSPSYNYITRGSMQNSLTLSKDEVKRRLDNGDSYVIRMNIPRKREIRFNDSIRGWVIIDSSELDDKILLKSDGMPTYHLANIVDDHLMQITHVIRGEEWLPSTAHHILLYEFFSWDAPEFAHLPLILKPNGEGKLSKRDGDQLGFPVFPCNWTHPITNESALGFREAGYSSEAFINFLALLGWNPGTNEEIMSIERMSELFTLNRVGHSGVRFDINKAKWFNGIYLKQMPLETLLYKVKELMTLNKIFVSDEYLLQVISLLKDRVIFLSDFINQSYYFFNESINYDKDIAHKKLTNDTISIISQFIDLVSTPIIWDSKNLEIHIKSISKNVGTEINKVLPALRFALTGCNTGPAIFDIMVLIGKEKTIFRLKNFLNIFK